MKKELLLIKLGGSIITDKNKAFTAKKEVIVRLAKEIKQALDQYDGDLIIGHGSGSFGHIVASKYQTQRGIIDKKSIKGFPLVSKAARKINQIVIDVLLDAGIKAVSFSPLSFIYSDNEKEKESMVNHIKKALEIGLIPVVYGDVIMDEKMGFCIYSGEKTLNLLAQKLDKNYRCLRIIYCGETNGVYDKNGVTIEEITFKNFAEIKSFLGKSSGIDVTGGMIHKVNEALEIAKELKAKTLIINATGKNMLKKAILGQKINATEVF